MKMIYLSSNVFIYLSLLLDLSDIFLIETLKLLDIMGFYASKKHKLYDACKKLIDKAKLPFYRSLTK